MANKVNSAIGIEYNSHEIKAVELVKKYNTESAGGFVNGTLRSISRKKDENGEQSEN